MTKQDPYAALRIKEFNIFLFVRFLLVFGWSMQFIVIEWQVYSITKDPLSLGIIGLMEIIPAFSMALFAGHIVDQKEKRNLLALCTAAFSLISLGLFLLTTESVIANMSVNSVLYLIYGLVFFGGFLRAFFGPTIFSLVALLVPKNIYHNAATWSTSTWKTASVSGALCGGFFIGWIGVDNTLSIIFVFGSSLVYNTFSNKEKTYFKHKDWRTYFRKFKSRCFLCFSKQSYFRNINLRYDCCFIWRNRSHFICFCTRCFKSWSRRFWYFKCIYFYGKYCYHDSNHLYSY